MANKDKGKAAFDSLKKLREDEAELKVKIDAQISTIKKAMDSELLNLVNLLVGQSIPSAELKLIKRKKSQTWAFEISFAEVDVKNRPEMVQAISDLSDYARSAKLKVPVEQEENS